MQREGRVPQVDAGEAPHFEHRLGAAPSPVPALGSRAPSPRRASGGRVRPCVSPATSRVDDLLPLRSTVPGRTRLEDLVEPVGHVEDAGTVVAQVADDLEQATDLARWQHGGGLVEHEHAAGRRPNPAARRRWPRSCARPVSPWTAAGGCRSRRRTAPSVGAPARSAPATVTRPKRVRAKPPSQREVVDGVQLEDEAEVLVDEAQAAGMRRACRGRARLMSTGSPSSHAVRRGRGCGSRTRP